MKIIRQLNDKMRGSATVRGWLDIANSQCIKNMLRRCSPAAYVEYLSNTLSQPQYFLKAEYTRALPIGDFVHPVQFMEGGPEELTGSKGFMRKTKLAGRTPLSAGERCSGEGTRRKQRLRLFLSPSFISLVNALQGNETTREEYVSALFKLRFCRKNRDMRFRTVLALRQIDCGTRTQQLNLQRTKA